MSDCSRPVEDEVTLHDHWRSEASRSAAAVATIDVSLKRVGQTLEGSKLSPCLQTSARIPRRESKAREQAYGAWLKAMVHVPHSSKARLSFGTLCRC